MDRVQRIHKIPECMNQMLGECEKAKHLFQQCHLMSILTTSCFTVGRRITHILRYFDRVKAQLHTVQNKRWQFISEQQLNGLMVSLQNGHTFSIMKGLIALGSSFHFQAGLRPQCLSPLAFCWKCLYDTYGASSITKMLMASILAYDNWVLPMLELPSC